MHPTPQHHADADEHQHVEGEEDEGEDDDDADSRGVEAAEVLAPPSLEEQEERIATLVSMGIGAAEALAALQSNVWDVNAAIESIFEA